VSLLIAIALVSSSLVLAASLRLTTLSSTLLAAYLAFVSTTVGIVLLLSAFQAVGRAGIGFAVGIHTVASFVVWWLRGSPRIPLGRARTVAKMLALEPVAAVFAILVAAVLVYELIAVCSAPPSNWDSLTYHLPRAAAWAQHGGMYWIPNAPTDRMNEFQPLAEQQLLFWFAATGKVSLSALPQFIGQLAIIVAVYSSARSLGYDPVKAACAGLLFGTFALVALESMTAQNDLAAASFTAIAAALLLAGGRSEVALAGVALSLGLGTKLTTALVAPVIVLLALRLGRRRLGIFVTGAAVGFVTLGMWGFVLNVANTGHVLGYGVSRAEHSASPSLSGGFLTASRVLRRFVDLSGFEARTAQLLALMALVALSALLVERRLRRASPRIAGGTVLVIFLALVGPLLLPTLTFAARQASVAANLPDDHPVASSLLADPNYVSSEDVSGFGPLGLAVAAVSAITIVAFVRRRTDLAHFALACALPMFLVILVLSASYNPWLMRFFIVPVALTTPLLARMFNTRLGSAAVVALALVTVGTTLIHSEHLPVRSAHGWPWNLTQAEALDVAGLAPGGATLNRLDAELPSRARVGAILASDEPSFLLYGKTLARQVTYLPVEDPLSAARDARLRYLVVSNALLRPLRQALDRGGWSVVPVTARDDPNPYWILAVRKNTPGSDTR
jgi:hypothetical protein